MTETRKELLARLVGFTPGPHYSSGQSVYSVYTDGARKGTNKSCAYVDDPRTFWGELECTAELYAAAPDLHRICTDQQAEIERLRDALATIALASKHYAKGDCDLSYAHQSTHNLAAAALGAKP